MEVDPVKAVGDIDLGEPYGAVVRVVGSDQSLKDAPERLAKLHGFRCLH